MEEVTRKRILRLLEGLPEAQLYQVLDYIEFLSAKYAAAASRKPDAFQRFAERVEDQMRVRALAPKAMKGTMKIMSTAGKMLEGVRDLGKDLVAPPPRQASRPADGSSSKAGASQPVEPKRTESPSAESHPVEAEPMEIEPEPGPSSGPSSGSSPGPEEGNGRRSESAG